MCNDDSCGEGGDFFCGRVDQEKMRWLHEASYESIEEVLLQELGNTAGLSVVKEVHSHAPYPFFEFGLNF